MLLLEELRKSPSEKSAGRQCSNEPGIKTPSGTLYLCGFGDASLRKHSTIYCGLRLSQVIISRCLELRKHSTIHCGLRLLIGREIVFLDLSESTPRYTVDWLLRSSALRLGHARASTVATLALRSSKTLKMLEVPQNTVDSTPTV